MPRIVSEAEKQEAYDLMMNGVSQREIERLTGLSRPYIRKLARLYNFQFPRNGVEVTGKLCMCSNCGAFFRRSKSKVDRTKNSFCSELCKFAYFRGSKHPSWKKGESITNLSDWLTSQTQYKEWREQVLERDGRKCTISGDTEELEAHHIMHKAESKNPEYAFDVNNGITLSKRVHIELHQLVNDGHSFEEAQEMLKVKYKKD